MVLPIYQEHGATYRADTCGPLERAMKAGSVHVESLARGHYPGRRLPRWGLPGLRTVGFWDAAVAQDWGLDWHRNEGIELTFLESGGLDFSVDETSCRLKPDDLTVTRPWQRHHVGNPNVGPGRLHWLIIDVGVRRPHQPWKWPSWLVLTRSDREELTGILRHNEQPVWHATPGVRQCFKQMAAAVEADRSGSQLSRLATHLNELFVLLLEMFRCRRVALDESLASTQRTVALFWADLCDHPDHLGLEWSLQAMARRCGLGVTHFIHYTKLVCNLTPAQYLCRCRLELAAGRLLKDTRSSVTQIALSCGFSSSQYFATVFRRQFGQTPRDFRKAREA